MRHDWLTTSTAAIGRWPNGVVVALGNFDGVHLGHRALIDTCAQAASKGGVQAVGVTFEPPPATVLRPEKAAPRLQTLEQKVDRLVTQGLDAVVVEPFDRDYAEQSAEWFIEEVLQNRLHAKAIVVGEDYRFGKDRRGDVAMLRQRLDIPIHVVSAVQHDEQRISSSAIRAALASGNITQANALLGRPHETTGMVVRGDGRGAKLGFPTANLRCPTDILIPQSGVYAARATLGQTTHNAVCNIGVRPTFDGEKRTIEVHLLDFTGDLYGRELTVEWLGRIRDEKKFESKAALITHIASDIEMAKAFFE